MVTSALGKEIDQDTLDRLWSRYQRAVRRPWLYVAGPMISVGGPYTNVHKAVKAGEYAWGLGWQPILPQLNAFWEMAGAKRTVEEWLALDFDLIARSNAVLFLPDSDKSVGAVEEAGFVEALDAFKRERIPCFLGVERLPSADAFHLGYV